MKTFFFFFGELKEVSLHHLENTPNSLKRVHSEWLTTCWIFIICPGSMVDIRKISIHIFFLMKFCYLILNLKIRFREVSRQAQTDVVDKMAGQHWNSGLSCSVLCPFAPYSLSIMGIRWRWKQYFTSFWWYNSFPPVPFIKLCGPSTNAEGTLHHHNIVNLDARFPSKESKVLCSHSWFPPK